MNIEQERAVFEAWYEKQTGESPRMSGDMYTPFATACWEAYQAGWLAMSEQPDPNVRYGDGFHDGYWKGREEGWDAAMAAVKESLTTVNQQLTDHLCVQERLRALLESAVFARDIAMKMTMKADIPYCAEFSAIAQELDAAIANANIAV